MSSQISYKDNKNRIRKKLSFIEGGHQLEKLEFALQSLKPTVMKKNQ